MRKIWRWNLGQNGTIPLLVLASLFGIILFIGISGTFAFKNELFKNLFPKPPSYADLACSGTVSSQSLDISEGSKTFTFTITNTTQSSASQFYIGFDSAFLTINSASSNSNMFSDNKGGYFGTFNAGATILFYINATAKYATNSNWVVGIGGGGFSNCSGDYSLTVIGPTLATPLPTPDPDSDGDGWSDSKENIIGTDPKNACPLNKNNDAWPPDLDNKGSVSNNDYNSLKHYIDKKEIYKPRFDLNADGVLDNQDLGILGENLGKSCRIRPKI